MDKRGGKSEGKSESESESKAGSEQDCGQRGCEAARKVAHKAAGLGRTRFRATITHVNPEAFDSGQAKTAHAG
jgi:hypothetical protein